MGAPRAGGVGGVRFPGAPQSCGDSPVPSQPVDPGAAGDGSGPRAGGPAHMGGTCRGPPPGTHGCHLWGAGSSRSAAGTGSPCPQPRVTGQREARGGTAAVSSKTPARRHAVGSAAALLIAALEVVFNYDKHHPLCGLLTLRFNAPLADLRAPRGGGGAAPSRLLPGIGCASPSWGHAGRTPGHGDSANTAASSSFHSTKRNVPARGEAHPEQLRGGNGRCCWPSSQSRG